MTWSSLPDYDRVAAVAEVRRCRGILPTGRTCHRDHTRGGWSEGVVHWADRQPTRPGIRRFLLLAAQARDPRFAEMPRWERIWRTNAYVYEATKALRIVLPKALADEDRAKVRASLAGLPPGTPCREEALAWSWR